jgi:hypothetical protein
MASPAKKPSLAERMAPKTATTTSAAPGNGPSVSTSFKSVNEDYAKRLTLDLTLAQHRKLKLRAMDTGVPMAQILRDYIDGITD